MYPIDFDTCSIADVIARSATCHPSLFADKLTAIAAIHHQASFSLRYSTGGRPIARGMGDSASDMARDLLAQEFDATALDFGAMIIAFGAACSLQCIPHATAKDIAGRFK